MIAKPVVMDNLGVIFRNEKERKEFLSDRARNYAELQKEINIPFTIDYIVFEKSAEEKTTARIYHRVYRLAKRRAS